MAWVGKCFANSSEIRSVPNAQSCFCLRIFKAIFIIEVFLIISNEYSFVLREREREEKSAIEVKETHEQRFDVETMAQTYFEIVLFHEKKKTIEFIVVDSHTLLFRTENCQIESEKSGLALHR